MHDLEIKDIPDTLLHWLRMQALAHRRTAEVETLALFEAMWLATRTNPPPHPESSPE